MLQNILLMTDSYKVSQYPQYPEGTTKVYSYLEARKGGEYSTVTFFELQYILKRYFKGKVVTRKKIEQADKIFEAHFGNKNVFNRAGWEYILKHHGGKLPIRIKAVAEGTVVPEGNVLLTIENTDPNCYWLVNYLETLIVMLWYGCTTATISREMKKVIRAALIRSGTNTPENLAFKLHDFGYRGSTSPESAAIGGSAHLINFKGTDTLAAIELLMEYYHAKMPGFSIPATEHSTITSWGEKGEAKAYENMLKKYPTGVIAVVSDSWDIYKAISEIWGGKLRKKVLRRNGALVIRPDSGDPCKILPAILNIIGEKFGFTMNEKGYKVIHEKVRVIQGDGIGRRTLKKILDAVMDAGWSADCLAFGSGGGLLQDCNRDTQRFAMKCSYIEVNGVGQDVFKRPATDPSKNSKRGRLMLVRNPDFATIPEGTPGETDLLELVFENGRMFRDQTFDEIIQLSKL